MLTRGAPAAARARRATHRGVTRRRRVGFAVFAARATLGILHPDPPPALDAAEAEERDDREHRAELAAGVRANRVLLIASAVDEAAHGADDSNEEDRALPVARAATSGSARSKGDREHRGEDREQHPHFLSAHENMEQATVVPKDEEEREPTGGG